MRILAPTRRTPRANNAVVTASDELAVLRQTKAKYAEEANKELARFNKLRSDFVTREEEIKSKSKEIAKKISNDISTLEARRNSLESTIADLEKSADANKYKALIANLEVSMLDLEKQKDFYGGQLSSLSLQREAINQLSDEIDERNTVCEAMEHQLLRLKSELEDERSGFMEDMEDRIRRLDAREDEMTKKESILDSKMLEAEAKFKTAELYKSQLDVKNGELNRKERYLADRKAKLDSLIAHYEQKLKS